MKALYLAGGAGTRLRPLTDRLPQPLMPLMGKPMLERNLETLKAHHVDEVVLSTCWEKDVLRQKLADEAAPGIQIHYVTEADPLGTGGAVKNCESFFDDTFFVFNADILGNINFSEMLRFHRRKKADVTMAVIHAEDPCAYGMVGFDGNGSVFSFQEEPKPHEIVSHFINTGVYIFEPKVLKLIPSGKVVSLERDVFPALLERGMKIAAYKGCNYWLDVKTPEKYVQAHRDGFAGKLQFPEVNFRERAVYSGEDAKISGLATLRGPVYLGKNVRIEPGAVVGPRVVIGDNSVVGKKCEIFDSILWSNVSVGDGTRMTECIVTDDSSVAGTSQYKHVIYMPDCVRSVSHLRF